MTFRAVFVDANPSLGDVAQTLLAGTIDIPFVINRQPDIRSEAIPATLAGAGIAVIDHTQFPPAIARQCEGLKHVVFLGTGARSYMSPEELGELGIAVHTIKGYGDTAVAECAVALMWAAARGFARMDREMRAGNWVRSDSLQLTGRTIGLLGFGGIAKEVARLASGMGMNVLAWNRSPKTFPGVQFVDVDRLLAESDVLSMHLLLNEDTKNFLSRERIAAMRPGAILINTARGALVDEDAMVDALRSGHLRHAGSGCFHDRAAAGGPRADLPAQRDAVCPLGVPDRRGQPQPDQRRAGPLPPHRGAGRLNNRGKVETQIMEAAWLRGR